MEELGLTQKALAEKMGCSQQYISRVLKGTENLSIETISKIETSLDLEILERVLWLVNQIYRYKKCFIVLLKV